MGKPQSDEIPGPEDYHSTPKWAGNGKGLQEEKNWNDPKHLSGQKNKNEYLWLRCYGWIVVILMVTFSLMFICSLGVWVFHQLANVEQHWLNTAQLSSIQAVIFSGSLGGIVSFVVQKHLSK